MRRKHRKLDQQPELDITAFMNLMIVLVPVLLLSMVFAHTAVLELNFPVLNDSQPPPELNDESQLQIIIRESGIRVADSKGGLISVINKIDGEHDYSKLSRILQAIKQRVPDKKDITILPEEEISYQELVSAMDTARSYQAVVAASVVEAELFPEISIGDAPELAGKSGEGS